MFHNWFFLNEKNFVSDINHKFFQQTGSCI